MRRPIAFVLVILSVLLPLSGCGILYQKTLDENEERETIDLVFLNEQSLEYQGIVYYLTLAGHGSNFSCWTVDRFGVRHESLGFAENNLRYSIHNPVQRKKYIKVSCGESDGEGPLWLLTEDGHIWLRGCGDGVDIVSSVYAGTVTVKRDELRPVSVDFGESITLDELFETDRCKPFYNDGKTERSPCTVSLRHSGYSVLVLDVPVYYCNGIPYILLKGTFLAEITDSRLADIIDKSVNGLC